MAAPLWAQTAPEMPPAAPAAAPPVPAAAPETPAVPAPDAAKVVIGSGQTLPATEVSNAAAPTGAAESVAGAVPTQGSIFYSDAEIIEIHKAIEVYVRAQEGQASEDDDFLKRLGDAAKVKDDKPAERSYFTYPQFFMESLVYNGPQEWSLRINGQEFKSGDTPPPNLHVVEITREKALMEWLPTDMEKVNQVWDAAPNEDVKVDKAKHSVMFSLHPNQTFSSYVMRVLEGKVRPMVIEITAPSVQPSMRNVVQKEIDEKKSENATKTPE